MRYHKLIFAIWLLVSVMSTPACAVGSSGGNGDRSGNSQVEAADKRQPDTSSTPEDAAVANTADAHVRAFFKWYLDELNAGRTPYAETAMLSRYLTKELVEEVRGRAGDKRFDPVLFLANDDTAWHRMKVQIGKPNSFGGKAVYDSYVKVTYLAAADSKPFTDDYVLGLNKTAEGWQIASVSIDQ
jgi:hypothetical protein